MVQQFFSLHLGVAVQSARIILNKLRHQLMEALLLIPVEHCLVDGLTEEALPKPADRILWVSFIQDLNKVFLLKDSDYAHYRFVRLIPHGTNVLEGLNPKYIAYHSR